MSERAGTVVEDTRGFELPPVEDVVTAVTDNLRPLREDEEYRERFYSEMGVVRTELTKGDELYGQQVFYKDERSQPSGSYKSRGASHAVLQHPEATRFITNSTGNHGTSLGIAGAKAGAEVVVEGTASMSAVKVERVRSTGATLNNVHPDFQSAESAVEARRQEPGTVVVAPFGCPEVVAGQCTLGDELVEDLVAQGLADKTVVIPVSVAGGGHITGVALPVWEAKQAGRLGPNVHVVAVQPEGTDTMNRALQKLSASQEPADLYVRDHLDRDCDALAIGETSLSPLTMAIVGNREFVAGFYTVAKADVGRAMMALEDELGDTVEPAAALGRAFAEAYAQTLESADEQAVFVLPISGGNKSPETHRKYEAAVRRDDFRRLSDAYLQRTVSPLEELLDHSASKPEPSAAAIRTLAHGALSGYTAEYRTPLVEPIRS